MVQLTCVLFVVWMAQTATTPATTRAPAASAPAARPVTPRLAAGTPVTSTLRRRAPTAWLVSTRRDHVTVVEVRVDADTIVEATGADGGVWRRLIGPGVEPVAIYVVGASPGRMALRPLEAAAVRATLVAREPRPRRTADEESLRGQAMLSAAEALARRGRQTHVKAADLFIEAARRFEASGDDGNVASALERGADLLGAAEEREKALPVYERLAAHCRATTRPSCEGRARLAAGTLLGGLGRSDEGQAQLRQARALFESLADPVSQARTLKQIGELEDTAGDTAAALRTYEGALALFQAAGDRGGEAEILSNIGVTWYNMSRPERALTWYRRAAPLFRAVGDHKNAAVNELNMGVAWEGLGEPERALRHHRRALDTLEPLGDEINTAYVLHGIGAAHRLAGNDRLAEQNIARALRLFTRRGEARGRTTALNSLGRIYLTSGRPREALEAHRQALQAFTESNNQIGRAYALSNIGDALIALGERPQARQQLDEALTVFRANRDRFGEGFALQRRAKLAREAGSFDEAQTDITAALGLIESSRAEIANGDQRASYFATVRDLHEFEIDLLAQRDAAEPGQGYDRRAFESCDRFRSQSLLEALSSIVDPREAAGGPLVDELRRLRTEIRTAMQAQSDADARPDGAADAQRLEARIAGLLEQYDERRRALESEADGSALRSPAPLTAADVQRTLLDERTVLIQYMLGDERSYAWLLTSDGLRTATLPPRRIVERAVQTLLADLSRPSGRRASIAAVDRLLFGEFRDAIREKRLLVSADGAIQIVPFAALPTLRPSRDPRRPMPEITVIPSIAVMRTIQARRDERRPQRRIAIFADAVYEPGDARLPRAAAAGDETAADDDLQRATEQVRGGSATTFSTLLYSGDEGRWIRDRTAPESTLHEGFAVSRDQVRRTDFSRYGTVHFAVHALLNHRRAELSGLVLSTFDAQGRPVDGFLRLSDIYGLRMPVDLVVLSACDTALGRDVRGEGVVGLTRSFLYAGASQVVSALWQVNDKSTTALMKAFYEGLRGEGLTPPAALRRAQASVARMPAFRDPYYWAGFTLQGDWR